MPTLYERSYKTIQDLPMTKSSKSCQARRKISQPNRRGNALPRRNPCAAGPTTARTVQAEQKGITISFFDLIEVAVYVINVNGNNEHAVAANSDQSRYQGTNDFFGRSTPRSPSPGGTAEAKAAPGSPEVEDHRQLSSGVFDCPGNELAAREGGRVTRERTQVATLVRRPGATCAGWRASGDTGRGKT